MIEKANFPDYVNFHHGKDFLICGNGYSILQYPPDWYENFDGITIGVNRILDYFTPDFYVNVEVPEGINWQMPEKVNCPWIAAISSKQPRANIVFDWTANRGTFYTNKDGLASWGHGSPFISLSLAYQMGAKSISIIGVDFCHGPDGQPYFTEHEEHVRQWYLGIEPEMREKSLRWWQNAAFVLEQEGIEVRNLSNISKLEFGETK